MRGCDVELERLDQSRQTRGLSFGKFENKSTQRRSVNDRMLEGTLEATTDEPGVERVMAVLDEYCTMREP